MHDSFNFNTLLHQRESGIGVGGNSIAWRNKFLASPSLVARFACLHRLEGHRGCVNTVTFDHSGDILFSGSDDRRVIMWNWQENVKLFQFDTGHTGNIFQSKPMPQTNNHTIITCAREGAVRQHLVWDGKVESKRLAYHQFGAHRISIEPESPFCFLSCGGDGRIYEYDLRAPEAVTSTIRVAVDPSDIMGLNAVQHRPFAPWYFATCGEAADAFIFDRRMKQHSERYSEYRGDDLAGVTAQRPARPAFALGGGAQLRRVTQSSAFGPRRHITGLVYSPDGRELLLTYSEDELFLLHSDPSLAPPVQTALRRSPRRNPMRQEWKRSCRPRPVLHRDSDEEEEAQQQTFSRTTTTTRTTHSSESAARAEEEEDEEEEELLDAMGFLEDSEEEDDDDGSSMSSEPNPYLRSRRRRLNDDDEEEEEEAEEDEEEDDEDKQSPSEGDNMSEAESRASDSSSPSPRRPRRTGEARRRSDRLAGQELNARAFIKSYSGHRNVETIKAANFFGADGELVVCGSDCGHFFVWDKYTGEIVQVLKGDTHVVNCLEPHPYSCTLATSGIDNDIKIWQPIRGSNRLPANLSQLIERNQTPARPFANMGAYLRLLAANDQIQVREDGRVQCPIA